MTAATPTDLDNLRLDAQTIAAVVNGEINQTVTTRTGKVLQTLSTISAAALPGAALGAVSAAQTEALTANTYNNGTAGVGATITAKESR